MLNISYNTIKCPHSDHTFNVYITVNFQKNDHLLQQAISEGKELSKNVNPHDPNNRIRTVEEIERRCICGVLAELTIKNLLKDKILKSKSNAKILPSYIITQGSKYGNQIDIPIEINGIPKEIEVRSSFPFSSLSRVITNLFDIIGWYSSSNKLGESPKDYYLRVLYNFNENEAMKYINSEIDLHFVGGATRKMLENLGHWDDFDQHGAKYRSIKPICAALDAEQILDNIFCNENELSSK